VTLKEARESYYELSAKLSELIRQLSFAGIAVIWMFRVGSDTGGIAFDRCLIRPLLLFVCALVLDLFHYLYGSIAWSRFAHVQEKKKGKKDDDKVSPSDWINRPSLFLFYGKTAVCAYAYVFLVLFLKEKL
jgi:hypothetical protein